MDEKIWYNSSGMVQYPACGIMQASRQTTYPSSCMNKMLHDQNYLMLVNKRQENSETNFLSQSSDDSDEYDRTGLFLRSILLNAAKRVYVSSKAMYLC